MIHVTRYHDISCGHRVVGHEGKCANLHGHNYRIHFTCTPEKQEKGDKENLDDVGRIIDFGVIKDKLCKWLDENWDHKFLIWHEDPNSEDLARIDPTVVWLDFNPTAENLALALLKDVAPVLLAGTGVILTRCIVEETRKCSAEVELGFYH